MPVRRSGLAVGHWPPNEKGMEKSLAKSKADDLLDQLAVISYGDEHYVPPAKIDDPARFKDSR